MALFDIDMPKIFSKCSVLFMFYNQNGKLETVEWERESNKKFELKWNCVAVYRKCYRITFNWNYNSVRANDEREKKKEKEMKNKTNNEWKTNYNDSNVNGGINSNQFKWCSANEFNFPTFYPFHMPIAIYGMKTN